MPSRHPHWDVEKAADWMSLELSRNEVQSGDNAFQNQQQQRGPSVPQAQWEYETKSLYRSTRCSSQSLPAPSPPSSRHLPHVPTASSLSAQLQATLPQTPLKLTVPFLSHGSLMALTRFRFLSQLCSSFNASTQLHSDRSPTWSFCTFHSVCMKMLFSPPNPALFPTFYLACIGSMVRAFPP